jgi:hypothetical protein
LKNGFEFFEEFEKCYIITKLYYFKYKYEFQNWPFCHDLLLFWTVLDLFLNQIKKKLWYKLILLFFLKNGGKKFEKSTSCGYTHSYMCTRFFSGGGGSAISGGGVKFVDPIFNIQVFSKKKNQIFFSKKIQKIYFFCVFFKKNEKKLSISSKLCILLLLCPIMI